MNIRTRFTAWSIALLFSAIAAPPAFAEWGDGFWPLNFDSRPEQNSIRRSSEEFSKHSVESYTADVEVIDYLPLEGDDGIVLLLIVGGELQMLELPEDDALLLLEYWYVAPSTPRSRADSLMLMVTPRIIIVEE